MRNPEDSKRCRLAPANFTRGLCERRHAVRRALARALSMVMPRNSTPSVKLLFRLGAPADESCNFYCMFDLECSTLNILLGMFYLECSTLNVLL